jgi:hypothetical protein
MCSLTRLTACTHHLQLHHPASREKQHKALDAHLRGAGCVPLHWQGLQQHPPLVCSGMTSSSPAAPQPTEIRALPCPCSQQCIRCSSPPARTRCLPALHSQVATQGQSFPAAAAGGGGGCFHHPASLPAAVLAAAAPAFAPAADGPRSIFHQPCASYKMSIHKRTDLLHQYTGGTMQPCRPYYHWLCNQDA